MGMFGENKLGLIARGNDKRADYHFQVSADGKTLMSWHCDPKLQPVPQAARSDSPCTGCGGEKITPPISPEENEAILRDGIT